MPLEWLGYGFTPTSIPPCRLKMDRLADMEFRLLFHLNRATHLFNLLLDIGSFVF